MRTIEESAPPAPQKDAVRDTYKAGKELSGKTFDIELITPMYGGGAIAGVNDSAFPIRPLSVRGQLRFWWRATRGAKFNTAEELFKAEEEIWGSTEKQSGTVVKVTAPEWAQSRNYIGSKDDNYGFRRFGPESYVLFPAAADTSRHNLVKEGLAFKIEFSFEQRFKADIFCAVWAWSSFGGIGARTRRGCGALFCKELTPEKTALDSVARWWQRKIEEYELQLGVKREWPTLFRILTGPAQANSLQAWQESISPMKNFRQGVGTGRNKGSRDPRRPGRSFWPEPDTLRRLLKKNNPAHKPDPNMPDGFPRAAFGLPILFHFAGSRGDPESEIHPKKSTRMSSPLILRPLKTQGGPDAVPVVIQLQGTKLNDLEVKGSSKTLGSEDIANPRFSTYRNAPMQKRSSSGSAIEAFLSYVKEQGFREV
ncbi:MAG: type III-B CRISPR module RAMP protein Cmr1 [Synergistaceae bacterium]|nr:type III-B CRISPR module RAMP protein Cmr1 [Synergistaceae bacterium]